LKAPAKDSPTSSNELVFSTVSPLTVLFRLQVCEEKPQVDETKYNLMVEEATNKLAQAYEQYKIREEAQRGRQGQLQFCSFDVLVCLPIFVVQWNPNKCTKCVSIIRAHATTQRLRSSA
jgi:hypothetical protein